MAEMNPIALAQRGMPLTEKARTTGAEQGADLQSKLAQILSTGVEQRRNTAMNNTAQRDVAAMGQGYPTFDPLNMAKDMTAKRLAGINLSNATAHNNLASAAGTMASKLGEYALPKPTMGQTVDPSNASKTGLPLDYLKNKAQGADAAKIRLTEKDSTTIDDLVMPDRETTIGFGKRSKTQSSEQMSEQKGTPLAKQVSTDKLSEEAMKKITAIARMKYPEAREISPFISPSGQIKVEVDGRILTFRKRQ